MPPAGTEAAAGSGKDLGAASALAWAASAADVEGGCAVAACTRSGLAAAGGPSEAAAPAGRAADCGALGLELSSSPISPCSRASSPGLAARCCPKAPCEGAVAGCTAPVSITESSCPGGPGVGWPLDAGTSGTAVLCEEGACSTRPDQQGGEDCTCIGGRLQGSAGV